MGEVLMKKSNWDILLPENREEIANYLKTIKEQGIIPEDINADYVSVEMVKKLNIEENSSIEEFISEARENEKNGILIWKEKEIPFKKDEYKVSFTLTDSEIIKKLKMLKGLKDIRLKREEAEYFAEIFAKAVNEEFQRVLND